MVASAPGPDLGDRGEAAAVGGELLEVVHRAGLGLRELDVEAVEEDLDVPTADALGGCFLTRLGASSYYGVLGMVAGWTESGKLCKRSEMRQQAGLPRNVPMHVKKYRLQYQKHMPNPNRAEKAIAKRFAMMTREVLGHFIDRNNVYRSQFICDGVPGIILRINDKIKRLVALLEGKAKESEDEDITENFVDIAVYGVMGATLHHFDIETKDSYHTHLFVKLMAKKRYVFECILCGLKEC